MNEFLSIASRPWAITRKFFLLFLGKTSLLGSYSVDEGTCRLQVARSQSIDLTLNKYQIGGLKKIKPSSAYRKSVVIAYFEERKKCVAQNVCPNFQIKLSLGQLSIFCFITFWEKCPSVSFKRQEYFGIIILTQSILENTGFKIKSDHDIIYTPKNGDL